jgi:hypothetical protein
VSDSLRQSLIRWIVIGLMFTRRACDALAASRLG